MGKKAAQPEVVQPQVPAEDPPSDPEAEERPDVPILDSALLHNLGWEANRMPSSSQQYFYAKTLREARTQPPYFTMLGLDESKYQTITKKDIWKAFFERKMQYKKMEDGALLEELKDPDDSADWDLVMQAYKCLSNPEARAEYEQRNLVPRAKRQLAGLVSMHEINLRNEEHRNRLLQQQQMEEAAVSPSPS